MRYLTLACLTLLSCTLPGCSSGNSTENENADSPVKTRECRIHSQLVYSRGHEAGCRALAYEQGSKEREAELLRAHAIISALEEKGYTYSAADFKAGLSQALKEVN